MHFTSETPSRKIPWLFLCRHLGKYTTNFYFTQEDSASVYTPSFELDFILKVGILFGFSVCGAKHPLLFLLKEKNGNLILNTFQGIFKT